MTNLNRVWSHRYSLQIANTLPNQNSAIYMRPGSPATRREIRDDEVKLLMRYIDIAIATHN